MAVQELHTTGLLFACVADKETEEIISQISLKNYDLKYEGMIGTIRDVVKYLKENRSPQILIIDISQSDLPINDIAKVSEVCEPGVEVIVIGMRNDVGVFRELVKLGIRDYLVKPLTNNHIVRSIENIVLEGQNKDTSNAFSKFGKIVSFIGNAWRDWGHNFGHQLWLVDGREAFKAHWFAGPRSSIGNHCSVF